MAQVWTVGFDEGHDVTVSSKPEGGNLSLPEAVDPTVERGTIGGHFHIGRRMHGRRVKSGKIPTVFRRGGSDALKRTFDDQQVTGLRCFGYRAM